MRKLMLCLSMNSPDVYERKLYTVLPITERCVSETSTMYGGSGYGNLRYMLPPWMKFRSKSRTTEEIQQLAYWYDYDNCGREVFQALATLTAAEVEEFASTVRCASLSSSGSYAGLPHREGGLMSRSYDLLGRSFNINGKQISDIIRGAITGKNKPGTGRGYLAPGTIIDGYKWKYKYSKL